MKIFSVDDEMNAHGTLEKTQYHIFPFRGPSSFLILSAGDFVVTIVYGGDVRPFHFGVIDGFAAFQYCTKASTVPGGRE